MEAALIRIVMLRFGFPYIDDRMDSTGREPLTHRRRWARVRHRPVYAAAPFFPGNLL